MDGEFTRTSVTVDEAVAILLDWVDGPIVFQPLNDDLSQEEQNIHDSLMYSVLDDLDSDKAQAESDLAEAIFDKMPESVIEARRETVQKLSADRARAKTYLCAIEDELNKGAMSALRVDVKRSNNIQTYVTLTSLDAWAKATGYRLRVLEPVPTAVTSSEEIVTTTARPKVRRRHRDQEEAIVAEIKRLGYNPHEYPASKPNSKGVKAEVWVTLEGTEAFHTRGVFEKAWQRARDNGDIAEKK